MCANKTTQIDITAILDKHFKLWLGSDSIEDTKANAIRELFARAVTASGQWGSQTTLFAVYRTLLKQYNYDVFPSYFEISQDKKLDAYGYVNEVVNQIIQQEYGTPSSPLVHINPRQWIQPQPYPQMPQYVPPSHIPSTGVGPLQQVGVQGPAPYPQSQDYRPAEIAEDFKIIRQQLQRLLDSRNVNPFDRRMGGEASRLGPQPTADSSDSCTDTPYGGSRI